MGKDSDKPKVILWPYRFPDMRVSWRVQYLHLISGLCRAGFDVRAHPDLKCAGMDLPEYDPVTDRGADVCIYNHATAADMYGPILDAKHNWFWKPTGPTPMHCALDPQGYGPYLSIGYDRPTFTRWSSARAGHGSLNIFKEKARGWIKSKVCKWGDSLKQTGAPIDIEDYYLILGQCAGDSVVTRMDFGDYVAKLKAVVGELLRIDSRPIVVKLHPYMDGRQHESPGFVVSVRDMLLNMGEGRVQVITGMCSVHPFIESARAVLLGNSGSGLEVMMHGKPIIAWGKPEYHWTSFDLRHLIDLRRAILLDWFDVEAQWTWLHWFCDHFTITDKKSAERRARELWSQVNE